ncbi:MAG: hypothetical protein KGQ47_16685, partial [Hyphomicrobiales bacterium]|nr:hypothetical protein [Hyphomicrobiales bacterium]
ALNECAGWLLTGHRLAVLIPAVFGSRYSLPCHRSSWLNDWGNRQSNSGANTGPALTRNVLKRNSCESACKKGFDAILV